jgi:hypothetical protein
MLEARLEEALRVSPLLTVITVSACLTPVVWFACFYVPELTFLSPDEWTRPWITVPGSLLGILAMTVFRLWPLFAPVLRCCIGSLCVRMQETVPLEWIREFLADVGGPLWDWLHDRCKRVETETFAPVPSPALPPIPPPSPLPSPSPAPSPAPDALESPVLPEKTGALVSSAQTSLYGGERCAAKTPASEFARALSPTPAVQNQPMLSTRAKKLVLLSRFVLPSQQHRHGN